MATLIAANPGLPIPELLDRLKTVCRVRLYENKPLDINDPDQRLALDAGDEQDRDVHGEQRRGGWRGFSLDPTPRSWSTSQLSRAHARPEAGPRGRAR